MPTTLKILSLEGSQLSLKAMQVLYTVLPRHSMSMTQLWLLSCKISDEAAHLLATVLHRLKRLEVLSLSNNHIHDSVLAIAGAILGHTTLIYVDLTSNPISASGRAALDTFKKTNNRWELLY